VKLKHHPSWNQQGEVLCQLTSALSQVIAFCARVGRTIHHHLKKRYVYLNLSLESLEVAAVADAIVENGVDAHQAMG